MKTEAPSAATPWNRVSRAVTNSSAPAANVALAANTWRAGPSSGDGCRLIDVSSPYRLGQYGNPVRAVDWPSPVGSSAMRGRQVADRPPRAAKPHRLQFRHDCAVDVRIAGYFYRTNYTDGHQFRWPG